MCLLSLGVLPVATAQEPIRLFDGESFAGWTSQNGGPVPDGWEIVDATIHLAADRGHRGHIVTESLFGDFQLDFEWKIEPGGNSGIKYRVRRFGNRMLGCEFQILDDSQHADADSDKTSTGSLYDLYAPSSAKYVRPVGEFNQSRIVVCGNRLEHWLNGGRILSASVGSWDWYAKKAESKFAETAGFGENRFGKIMLTDHGSDVWYRNLQLIPLEGCTAGQSYAGATAVRRPLRRFNFWRCRRRLLW